MKNTKAQQNQAALLRTARKQLGKTNAELAATLGISKAGLLAWLAPAGAAKHREMPKGARLLLAAVLAQHSAKK